MTAPGPAPVEADSDAGTDLAVDLALDRTIDPTLAAPTFVAPRGAAPTGRTIDPAAARHAVRDLLLALGEDPDDVQLRETPRRVAAAFEELLTPAAFAATTFPNEEHYDQLVVARSIPMRSLCAHHLLPFIGVAHVAYLPGERIIGLSKLARVVDHYSRRLQLQERLTTQIGRWLVDELDPKGVGVVIEAEHLCMTLRGIEARGARTVTSSLHGLVRDDPRTRAEFLSLVDTPARPGDC